MNTENTISLSSINKNAIMSAEEAAQVYETMSKKEEINKKFKIDFDELIKEREDGRCYIYIKRKQYAAQSYKELIAKVYGELFIKSEPTLASLYPEMMIYKRDSEGSSAKTLKEYAFRWEKLKEMPICNKPIKSLTTNQFIMAFEKLINEQKLSKQAFRDIKSVFNSIYFIAIANGIVAINPIKEINNKDKRFRFRPRNTGDKKKNLTIDERNSLINYLAAREYRSISEEIYALAIQFDLYVIMRIGELKSLKWTDLKDDYIRVQTQEVSHQSMNDDLTFNVTKHIVLDTVKGMTDQGYRNIPLSATAKALLNRVKEINSNCDYIFRTEEGLLTTITFNRYLAKYCKEVGIEPVSSHGLRFTVASVLYQSNTMSPTELQELLGHTTLAMTLHYLKSAVDNSVTANKMCAFLG